MSMNEMECSSPLPHQIIMDEILIRLPVKSLCRFKAVSKLWNAVISSSQFAKAHLNNNKLFKSNLTSVIFRQNKNWWLLDHEAYDDDEDLLPKSFHFSRDTVTPGGLISFGNEHLNVVDMTSMAAPVGSSCGLICFLHYGYDSILLCNPILHQYRRIATPHRFFLNDLIICGFGYVSSSDDFKFILGLRGQCEDNRPMIYIFSLRDNHWRTTHGGNQLDVISRNNPIDKYGILLNERLHWWTVPISPRNGDSCVTTFDLVNEVFNKIPIPEELSIVKRFHPQGRSGLSTIGGYLCYSKCSRFDYIELWILKQYGETDYSWVRLYNLSNPIARQMNAIMLGLGKCFHCFGFTKTGKFLIWCYTGLSQFHVLLVDPSHSHPKVTAIGNYHDHSAYHMQNYVESLVSPIHWP